MESKESFVYDVTYSECTFVNKVANLRQQALMGQKEKKIQTCDYVDIHFTRLIEEPYLQVR